MAFSRTNSHAIALRVSFSATVCAGVCARTLQDGLWFVVAVCVLCVRIAAGSSVKLRSDQEMFVSE